MTLYYFCLEKVILVFLILFYCIVECCWAFAAAAAVESLHAIKKKELINLSVQQILDRTDTSNLKNNLSGEHGNSTLAFDYIQSNGGLTSWDRYPFPRLEICHSIGYKGNCNHKLASQNVARIDGYLSAFNIDENSLRKLVNLQPVVVAIAMNSSWHTYDGGFFQGYGTEKSKFNHEV